MLTADTNLFIHAADPDARHHAKAREFFFGWAFQQDEFVVWFGIHSVGAPGVGRGGLDADGKFQLPPAGIRQYQQQQKPIITGKLITWEHNGSKNGAS